MNYLDSHCKTVQGGAVSTEKGGIVRMKWTEGAFDDLRRLFYNYFENRIFSISENVQKIDTSSQS
jgi:hypothetical protein